jgi:hypothetical protein
MDEEERIKKISGIIVALITVSIVIAITGSIVITWTPHILLPSEQWVQYQSDSRQYGFRYVPNGSPEDITQYSYLDVDAENYIPTNQYTNPEILSPVTQGDTWNVFGMTITATEVTSDYLVISISSPATASWQETSAIYLIVIEIVLAIIIALLLLIRHRKTSKL